MNAVESALPAVGARFVHDQEKKWVDIDINGERMGISIAEDYALTDPTEARLELLRAGISGYDYNRPFGRSVVA